MRCFETAARLNGFAAAAEELSVTPGAISQQVKALEDWVGAALFERRSQGVVLTPLGEKVAGDFTHAFDTLGDALHSLRTEAPKQSINIAALPSVAQLWLSPRLPAIRAAFPGHMISVTALENPPNLRRELFDISIFFGKPTGSAAQRSVGEDMIFPVCAPEIATRLTGPPDLLREPLISDATWDDDWENWLKGVGLDQVPLSRGPVFSLYSIAVDETRNGAGVMIGHKHLIGDLLDSGLLVRPFEHQVSTGQHLILETLAPKDKRCVAQDITNMLIG